MGSRENLRQADVSDFDILVGPLVEELDGADLLCDFLGEDLVPAGVLDLDFAVVGHGCGGRSQCSWGFRDYQWVVVMVVEDAWEFGSLTSAVWALERRRAERIAEL